MTIEVWYGSKPDNAAEQEILVELHQFLSPKPEHYVVLVNFHPGSKGNEIDLVVLKETGVFLAELKHIWEPIIGSREGEWKILKPDGGEVVLNKGRRNPFKQTQVNYYHWKNWCESNQKSISMGLARTMEVNYSRVFTYLVFYPDMPDGSQIDIGEFPVQAVGFSKFRDSLPIRGSNDIALSRQEMSQIPQLLKLSFWSIEVMPKTVTLANWQPRSFAALVCRGHSLSTPMFRLDALNKTTITVGRGPENDLVIHHPAVSEQHAVFEQVQGRYVVRDLGSANGTYVSFNGDITQEIQITNRTNAVKNNSIVRFGPAVYTFLQHQ